MTQQFELTRRKILASVGAVGAAGAGAGLGTSALFSDEESFENNSITAGTLDLIVDYYTSYDYNDPEGDSTGTVNGDGATEYSYVLSDVKPGDSGTLAFCPKVVDNPAYLTVGSDGVVDYENGHTEPERDVDDDTDGDGDNDPQGSLGNPNDGEGFGELSDAIEVTVSYAGSVDYDPATGEITCNDTRELNNPDGYTLNDLVTDLEYGFPLDGNEPNDGDDTIDPYPASSNGTTQEGPCLCIEWELPASVGNEVQSDALELDFTFAAEQARNNDAPPVVVYNDFYNHFNGPSTIEVDFSNDTDSPWSSWAYAAQNVSGWGGIVGLGSSGAPGFELTSGAVIMSNWNGWDPSGGPGTETPGYSHPFTLELYEVNRNGSDPAAGTLIDEFTETQDVPKREVPDNSNKNYAGNGTNFLMEWDLDGLTVSADELLFIVSFEITGPNQNALSSMNISSYDSFLSPEITAGYSANDDVWYRPSGGSITKFNVGDFPQFYPEGVQGGSQVMSRFEGRPL